MKRFTLLTLGLALLLAACGQATATPPVPTVDPCNAPLNVDFVEGQVEVTSTTLVTFDRGKIVVWPSPGQYMTSRSGQLIIWPEECLPMVLVVAVELNNETEGITFFSQEEAETYGLLWEK